MSKKDYIAVAAILRDSELTVQQRAQLALSFADMFFADNGAFNRNVFYRAAGVLSESSI